MKEKGQLSAATLSKSIQACLDNGARLINESYDLEFRSPCGTRFYLVAVAQEEYAKAFILFLVREGVAPFTSAVRRAIRDHSCKQLVGMVLDYIIMHWDEIAELHAMIDVDHELHGRLPHDIGSALELFCYEKSGRWAKSHWGWDEDPKYDRSAVAIAEGKKDSKKQDALYVRIGADGQTCSIPNDVAEKEIDDELERARRYKACVQSMLDGNRHFSERRYDKVMEAFVLLLERERNRATERELIDTASA
jgi:hypothetical protein